MIGVSWICLLGDFFTVSSMVSHHEHPAFVFLQQGNKQIQGLCWLDGFQVLQSLVKRKDIHSDKLR